MPLMLLSPGKEVFIRRVSGDCALRQRLAEMGFVAGAPVQMLGSGPGGVILRIKGCRMALGEDLARHIFV